MNEDEMDLFYSMVDTIAERDQRKRVPALVQEAREEGLELADALALAEWEVR